MYVGRTLEQLKQVPYPQWTIEELAYHQSTMRALPGCLNEQGQDIWLKVLAEIESRGGLPHSEGAYDHSSDVIYD